MTTQEVFNRFFDSNGQDFQSGDHEKDLRFKDMAGRIIRAWENDMTATEIKEVRNSLRTTDERGTKTFTRICECVQYLIQTEGYILEEEDDDDESEDSEDSVRPPQFASNSTSVPPSSGSATRVAPVANMSSRRSMPVQSPYLTPISAPASQRSSTPTLVRNTSRASTRTASRTTTSHPTGPNRTAYWVFATGSACIAASRAAAISAPVAGPASGMVGIVTFIGVMYTGWQYSGEEPFPLPTSFSDSVRSGGVSSRGAFFASPVLVDI